MEESSFLKNDTSLFTFIKKTKSQILSNSDEEVIDINLMSPMIVKNCLPFEVTFSFMDSSDVKQ